MISSSGNQRSIYFQTLAIICCYYILKSIKLARYRMEIKFGQDILSVKENNHLTEIVDAYIVYDLDTWRPNNLNNFQ